MNNFWNKLEKPILALAPMADVTDAAYRFIIAKYGKSDVMYTEFVSADGLVLAPEASRKKLLKDLEYSESERPIVAQFFTSKPENMEKVARLAVELGFDGVDINMGCPDRSIEKQGAGAALMKNPKLARELIRAAKKGTEGKIPVSVKTRLGYNEDNLETWLPELLAESPAAITIHARTRKEMSKAPARWERVKRAVEIRDSTSSLTLPLAKGKGTNSLSDPIHFTRGGGEGGEVEKTLILGNGDILNILDVRKKCKETGADGAMLGRAIFGNPWLFSPKSNLGLGDRLNIIIEHTNLFEEKFRGVKSFAIMKKHYKAYLKDIPNSHELKMKLMEAESANEVEEIVSNWNIQGLPL